MHLHLHPLCWHVVSSRPLTEIPCTKSRFQVSDTGTDRLQAARTRKENPRPTEAILFGASEARQTQRNQIILHRDTPARNSSSCVVRGGHLQLISKPGGARGIAPETSQTRGQLISQPPTTGPNRRIIKVAEKWDTFAVVAFKNLYTFP